MTGSPSIGELANLACQQSSPIMARPEAGCERTRERSAKRACRSRVTSRGSPKWRDCSHAIPYWRVQEQLRFEFLYILIVLFNLFMHSTRQQPLSL